MQCKKSLYLNAFHKKERNPIDPITQEKFDAGHSTGFLARELFPNGIDVSIPKFKYSLSYSNTQKLIRQNEAVVYEATFLSNTLLCMLDILVVKNGELHVFEVKNSSSMKEVFENDAAFQFYVMNECGYRPASFSIMHRNPINLNSVKIQDQFVSIDITKQCIDKQECVKQEIEHSLMTLQVRRIPEVVMSAHCETPYPCDFTKFCLKTKMN